MVEVKKSNGNFEKFSPIKLNRSLQFAGLSKYRAAKIVEAVKKDISDGDSTKDIFKRAYNLVRKESPIAAVHYSLKKSLLGLGPAGFVFEEFVSKIFQEFGFEVQVGSTFKGKWVRHEVDVIATKDNKRYFVECKFHNSMGRKNDIKVALYVKARWDDLNEGPEGKKLDGYYLASNTAFSLDALTYGEGTGLRLLGVNAPTGKSFMNMIEDKKLYPITSLSRLKKTDKVKLLKKGVILCKELLNNRQVLEKLGLEACQIDLIFADITNLIMKKDTV